METVLRFIGDRKILLLLDNCEHLLDVSGEMITTLLNGCPQSDDPDHQPRDRSRSPARSPGACRRCRWTRRPSRCSSTAPNGRGRRSIPQATTPNWSPISAAASTACRWRSNWRRRGCARCRCGRSLTASTTGSGYSPGGARNALRRQQTLRASVDWSHALLTRTRAHPVSAGSACSWGVSISKLHRRSRQQPRPSSSRSSTSSACWSTNHLSSPTTSRETMRYRLLETVRQYAIEKLAEVGEADAMRDRHRDHYVGCRGDYGRRRATGRMGRRARSATCAAHMHGAWTAPNSSRPCG